MFIRPIRLEDHEAILGLAQQAGIGMTSLPPDAEVLYGKIEKSVKSFQGIVDHPADESYLFVLEDRQHQRAVGICGIKCHIGMRQPFYSYKVATITQVSKEYDIFSMNKVLHVVNDYAGCSEIASLFLAPEARRDRMGRFLSRVRFMVIAEYRERFHEKIIAEIRGVSDSEGRSPFYDGIARHFFQMDFKRADYLNATKGNQFITDLMPKHPIYVSLLPRTAREALGAPNQASAPAKILLEEEGFRWNDYVDIFDGGPTLECRRDDIATVRESRYAVITDFLETSQAERAILCTVGPIGKFRAIYERINVRNVGADGTDEIAVLRSGAEELGLKIGDRVRYATG